MGNENIRLKHKEWRKIVKKKRRKRIRQKLAKQRDAEINRFKQELLKDPNYIKYLKEQEEQEESEKIREEQQRVENEKRWLENEDKAQKEWSENEERKEKARQTQLEQEEIVKKEFDDKEDIMTQKKKEEKRRFEEEMRKQKEFEQHLDDYIDKGANTPENMRCFKETNPGKDLCPFFDKTNACRYGDNCSRNHRKIGLSKVILIPHFYSHFSLERNNAEYDTDNNLEYDISETRRHFREFYKDIVPELENFGRIKTLRVCCNGQFHLRGNVYAEYYSERYAAHAVRNLKGRWYGGRQLHCEFANITSWRHAICGLKRNCPKGKRTCNFLHTFRNPDDEYAVKSPPKYVKSMYGYTAKTENCNRSERRTRSKWGDTKRLSGDENNQNESRNWRWSESPEQDQDNYQRNDNRNYYYRNNYRNYYRRDNKRYDNRSRTPSSISSSNSSTPERRKRSTSRRSRHKYKRSRNHDYYSDDDDDDYRRRKKHRSSSSRHRNYHRSSNHRHHRRRSHRDHRSRKRDSPYSSKYDSDYDKRSQDSKDDDDKEDDHKTSAKEKVKENELEKKTSTATAPAAKITPNQISSNEVKPSHLNYSDEEEEESSSDSDSSEDSTNESGNSQPEISTVIQKKTHYQAHSVPIINHRIKVPEREYEWDTTESESEGVKK